MELAKLRSLVPGIADISINCDQFSIGRGLGNTHVIVLPEISRRHCQFDKVNGEWTITDKSTNGILVNSKFIEKNKPTKVENSTPIILSENYKFKFVSSVNIPGTVFTESQLMDIADRILAEVNSSEAEVATADAETVPIEDILNAQRTSRGETPQVPVLESEETIPFEPNIASTAIENAVPASVVVLGTSARSSEVNRENTLVVEPIKGTKPTPDQQALCKIVDDAVEDELHCSICTELFIKAVTLNCSHTYCSFCISKWKLKNMLCPICREKITSTSPTIVLDSFINRVMEVASEEVKQWRTKVIKERELESSPSTSSTAVAAGATTRLPTEPHQHDSLVEIISSDSDDTFSEYSGDEWNLEYDDDEDDWDTEYNGLPGVYYGGYGRCYSCGESGHWANGCPMRPSRR